MPKPICPMERMPMAGLEALVEEDAVAMALVRV